MKQFILYVLLDPFKYAQPSGAARRYMEVLRSRPEMENVQDVVWVRNFIEYFRDFGNLNAV